MSISVSLQIQWHNKSLWAHYTPKFKQTQWWRASRRTGIVKSRFFNQWQKCICETAACLLVQHFIQCANGPFFIRKFNYQSLPKYDIPSFGVGRNGTCNCWKPIWIYNGFFTFHELGQFLFQFEVYILTEIKIQNVSLNKKFNNKNLWYTNQSVMNFFLSYFACRTTKSIPQTEVTEITKLRLTHCSIKSSGATGSNTIFPQGFDCRFLNKVRPKYVKIDYKFKSNLQWMQKGKHKI